MTELYSLSGDFLLGLDINILNAQIIESSVITTQLISITLDGDSVILLFSSPLSNAEKNTIPGGLNNIIANHDPNSRPINDIVDLTNIYLDATLHNFQLLSGYISWNTNFKYATSTLKYLIEGILYSSNGGSVDLAIPNLPVSNPRVDIIYVNTAGTVGVATGSEAIIPLKPALFLNQLELLSVHLSVGTSEPDGILENILYKENLGIGGGEWNATHGVTLGTINVNSTNSPYAGLKSIEFTNVLPGDELILNYTSGKNIGNIDIFEFYIKSKAEWIGENSAILLYNKGEINGIPVNFQHNSYDFNSGNLSTYQRIAISMKDFSVTGNTVDQVRFRVANGTIGFFIDNVRFQEGITQPTNEYGETNLGLNVNLTGVGVFKQKTGATLEFKGINSSNSTIIVTNDTTNNIIDISTNLSGISSNISHDLLIGAGFYSHSQIDSHITNLTIHRQINDSGTSSTALWSSAKIASELVNLSHVNGTFEAQGLSVYNVTGGSFGFYPTINSSVDVVVTLPGNAPLDKQVLQSVGTTGTLVWANKSALGNSIVLSDTNGNDFTLTLPVPMTGDVNWTLPPNSGTTGYFLQITDTATGALAWAPASGSGETNNGTNIGIAGVGVFDSKLGVNLQFKNLYSTTGSIILTNVTSSGLIDLNVNVSNISSNISHDLLIGAGFYSHSQIDSHITNLTIHRQINDSGTSSTALWSSAKIASELINLSHVNGTFEAQGLSVYNVTGGSFGFYPTINSSVDVVVTLPGNAPLDKQVLQSVGTDGTLVWANKSALGNSLVLSDTNGNDFTLTLPVPMTGDVNWTLPSNSGTTGYFLQITDTATGALAWAPASGSGETNTASNVGVYGTGLFDGKVGVDLQFKNLYSTDGSIIISDIGLDNVIDLKIDLSIVAGNISHDLLIGAGFYSHSQIDSHVSDSTIHRTINDSGTSSTALWSSAKIASELVNLSHVNGTFEAQGLSVYNATGGSFGFYPTINSSVDVVVTLPGNAPLDKQVLQSVGTDGTLVWANKSTLGNSLVLSDTNGNDFTLTLPVPMTGDVNWTLPPNSGTTGYFLQITDTATGALAWASAGETNNGTNIGIAGIGVFDSKLGVNLQFRNLYSTTDSIILTNVTSSGLIDLNVNMSNISSNISHDLLIGAGFYSHSQIDSHVSDSTIHRTINDSGTSSTALWSSAKIASELVNLSHVNGTFEAQGLSVYNTTGGSFGFYPTVNSSVDVVVTLPGITPLDKQVLQSVGTDGTLVWANKSALGNSLVLSDTNGNDFTLTLPVPMTGDVNWTLPPNSGTTGYFLQITDTSTGALAWAPASGSGETNTASNVGVYGTGLFDGKVGVDLQFKNLYSTDGSIIISDIGLDNVIDLKIDLSIVAGNISHDLLIGAGFYSHSQIDSHVSDSTIHRTINDSGTSSTALWSSAKIASELVNLSHVNGTFEAQGLSVYNATGGSFGFYPTINSSVDVVVTLPGNAPLDKQVLQSVGTDGTLIWANKSALGNSLVLSDTNGNDFTLTLPVPMTGDVNWTLPPNSGTTGYFLQITDTATGALAWAPASGSGETNTASNIGVYGTGLFDGKVGVDLQFKNLYSTDGSIIISDIGLDNVIDLKIDSSIIAGNISHDLLIGAGFYSHSQIDSHVSDSTIHRTINDSGTSSTALWSSAKIASELVNLSHVNGTFEAQGLSVYNVTGGSFGFYPTVNSSVDVVVTLPGITPLDKQVLQSVGTDGTLVWANKSTLGNSLVLSDTNGNDFTLTLPVPMTGDVNWTLPPNSGTTGYFLQITDTATGALAWAPASGSGETNTASNVGVYGTGLFDGKVGVDLQFKNLYSTDGSIIISDIGIDNVIDLKIDSSIIAGNISHDLLIGAGFYSHSQIDSHVSDSTIHRTINDSGTSSTALWSSAKIASELINLSHVNGTFEAAGLSVYNATGGSFGFYPTINSSVDVVVTLPGITPLNKQVLQSVGTDGTLVWANKSALGNSLVLSDTNGNDYTITLPVLMTGDVNWTLPPNSGTTGYFLQITDTATGALAWAPASGSGETNTASNVGVYGTGLFDGKVGVDLQFKNLYSTDGSIIISDIGIDNVIDLKIDSSIIAGNISHDLLIGAGFYSHSQIDSHVSDSTIHRTINDSGTSSTALWSSAKIASELINLSHVNGTFEAQGLIVYNATGGSFGFYPTINSSVDVVVTLPGITPLDKQVLQSVGTDGTLVWANKSALGNSLVLSDTNGNDYTITLPVPMTGDLNITLPNNSGTVGNFLILNDTTTGQLIWGDHGNIAGLGDDDHVQYALLAGRTGGQILIGGLNMTENLILRSTSNSTKGEIISDSNIRLGLSGGGAKDLLLQENDGGSSYVGLRGPESMTTSYRLAFPDSRGTIGQLLGINGTSGSDISTLSWYNRNLYGQQSEYYFRKDNTVTSSVSNTSFTKKINFTTDILPIGDYKISWNYQWSYNQNTTSFIARLVLDGDTTDANLLMDHQEDPYRGYAYGEASATMQKITAAGFSVNTFNTNTTHSLSLEYKPETAGRTAYIAKARVELHRVS
jgi:hypothetical protein